MNLHGIVSGYINAVNPAVDAVLRVSTGWTTAADGTRTPAYASPISLVVQVQALTGKDIKQTDNLNLQGVVQAVYLTGDAEGLVRVSGKGGDLLTFDGQTWLVESVLERWPDWVKVAVTQQVTA